MRLVVDTNVIVSALLKPGSVPDRAVEAICRNGTFLADERIVAEYREVLSRPKFRGVGRDRIDALLAALARRTIDLGTVASWTGAMTDDDDRIFVEAALAGRADAIVTGNIRDFPGNLGFAVLPPATLLARLEERAALADGSSR